MKTVKRFESNMSQDCPICDGFLQPAGVVVIDGNVFVRHDCENGHSGIDGSFTSEQVFHEKGSALYREAEELLR